jgi:aryl-alcohol dehydrogenase-like predicted oxidoreductase
MTYGSTDWQGWLLDEETGLEHIKVAYDAGINAFDTANVSLLFANVVRRRTDSDQLYSNGKSEEILGRAIKAHNLPRDEIVIMTKAQPKFQRSMRSLTSTSQCSYVRRCREP